MASLADAFAEREAATLMMLSQWEQAPPPPHARGGKAYDTLDFVDVMRNWPRHPRNAESGATWGQCNRWPHHTP